MSDEPSIRSSRRRGLWWKLPLAALGLMAVIGALGHALWTGKERARADALVTAIRASGEPIDVADLADPSETPVAAGQNIVTLIRAAGDAVVNTADLDARENALSTETDDAFSLPLTDAERAVLAGQQTANAAAVAILGGLDGRSGVAWGDAYATPMLLRTDADYGGVRRLANLLGDRARLAADEGRGAEAVAAIRDVGPLATAIGAKPSIIGYLVAAGVHSLAADRALELAPSLTIGDAAARADVERLIAELLDDAAVERIARRGIVGERVAGHDTLRAMASGTVAIGQITPGATTALNGVTRVAAAPIIHRSDAAILAYHTEVLRHLDAPSHAAFKARAGTLRQMELDVQASSLNLFARIMMPSLARAMETRYRVVAERHLAATALAVRKFALDHDGRRPATLAELVPAYLPRVPTDALDGELVRYDPTRAILWHVGRNGTDDGGSERAPHPRHVGDRWQMLDGVVRLDRQPRLPVATGTTTPATAPALGATTAPAS